MADSPPPSLESFDFTSLPGFVKNMVYMLLFDHNREVLAFAPDIPGIQDPIILLPMLSVRENHSCTHYTRLASEKGLSGQLLRVSKTLKKEATPILYGNQQFFCHNLQNVSMGLLPAIGKENFGLIRKLELLECKRRTFGLNTNKAQRTLLAGILSFSHNLSQIVFVDTGMDTGINFHFRTEDGLLVGHARNFNRLKALWDGMNDSESKDGARLIAGTVFDRGESKPTYWKMSWDVNEALKDDVSGLICRPKY